MGFEIMKLSKIIILGEDSLVHWSTDIHPIPIFVIATLDWAGMTPSVWFFLFVITAAELAWMLRILRYKNKHIFFFKRE